MVVKLIMYLVCVFFVFVLFVIKFDVFGNGFIVICLNG